MTVKGIDTDIVVIAVSILQFLQELALQRLWIALGQGQNIRSIYKCDLCYHLTDKPNVCSSSMNLLGAMLFQHYAEKGRRAWQTWDVCTESMDVFRKLMMSDPVQLSRYKW